MAINIPIITSLEDTGIKNAKAAFGDLKTAVGNAEGGMGKFKAGSKVALDAVKANAGTLAIAGAAAFGTFATKAITAFQDIAIGAGKFADATGLSVEDASRYLEVAGDLSIPVDAVEGAIGRLNKTIGADPDKVRNLGVDIEYLNDGSLDVNETFLNTIDRLKKIKDPAEKARVATQLLGKGWQSMAELIEMGADDLKASLDSVSSGQVISDEELAKAKEYRDTVQKLGDYWNAFVIDAGGFFVGLAANYEEFFSGWDGFTNQIKQTIGEVPLVKVLGEIGGLFNDNEENAKAAEEAAKDLGDAYSGYVSSRLADSREEINKTNIAIENQAEELVITDLKWQALIGTLKLDSAMADAKEQLAGLKEKAVEAYGGSKEAVDQYNESLINAQLMVLALAGTVALTNAEKNQIRILVDTEQLDRAISLIGTISAGGYTPELNAMRFRGARALGGPVSPGGSYLVGERGPELFTPSSSGNITPNHAMGGGGNTINITVQGADPNSIVRALQQYVRQSGPVPVNTRAM
jgi:hypothetical protein